MITIDLQAGTVHVTDEAGHDEWLALASPQAFRIISQAWLRCGWDNKYVYSFTWQGRPIIQLPEDLLRLQEVIYQVQPDVIVETGIAHGGSLMFYATLCKAMGKGRVIGIDKELRPQNRQRIQEHVLYNLIELIDGDSIAPEVIAQVHDRLHPGEKVMVLLDSCHTKEHVRAELEGYAPIVGIGSYLVAMDGIMAELAHAPRSAPDWAWNNPQEAAREFVISHPEFVIEEPAFLFNEGNICERVTYWPSAFIKRVGA